MVPQRFLIIDGIHIPVYASESLTQSLTPISDGKHYFRTIGGNRKKQTHWQSLQTLISGTGSLPHGLNGIDYTKSYDIHCIKSRSVRSITPSHTATRTPRTDIPPVIIAHIGNLQTRTLASVTSGNIISGVPVPNAEFYTIAYYPIITVLSDEPSDELDLNPDTSTWSLTAEEIASVD